MVGAADGGRLLEIHKQVYESRGEAPARVRNAGAQLKANRIESSGKWREKFSEVENLRKQTTKYNF